MSLNSTRNLIEERVWLGLSNAVEILNIDQLEVVEESGVCNAIFGPYVDVGQVA